MRVAPLRTLIALAVLSCSSAGGSAHAADRVPLVGNGVPDPFHRASVVSSAIGDIVPIDTALVSCATVVTFSDVNGGASPGTDYDGVLDSGGLLFSERFAGQSLASSSPFDVVTGTPSDPLQSLAGEPGQNLDVFDFAGNALAGLGPIGFPDIDAIGEGSIAIYFSAAQSRVRFSLVGGNGGSATLRFYRRNGSLIDEVVVSGLADLAYAFGTRDDGYDIAGVLIQNDDASGMGIDDICYDGAPVSTRTVSWGSLKQRYR
jgi:hypothetical protein